MTPERWRRIDEVFAEAVGLDRAARDAWLRTAATMSSYGRPTFFARSSLLERRWSRLCSKHPTPKMRAAVVVVGDLGRSPRMQYHARALAAFPAAHDRPH